MRIAGMTCAGCAKGWGHRSVTWQGLWKADVDYKAGQAIITLTVAKQSAESLSRFVTKCGYEVKELRWSEYASSEKLTPVAAAMSALATLACCLPWASLELSACWD